MKLNHVRNLRLFVDVQKVPIGAEIILTADGAEPPLEISRTRTTVKTEHLVTANVAQVEFPVRGKKLCEGLMVSASHAEYVAGTTVSVTKKREQDKDRQGLFKGYKFQPLDRKLQTLWIDGWVLINTKDPVNVRYFGDDPEKVGETIERNPDCQVLLAELMLNECLQIMVTQALDLGRLDRHFPNNPEIDVRNYVEAQKFEIGANIHTQF